MGFVPTNDCSTREFEQIEEHVFPKGYHEFKILGRFIEVHYYIKSGRKISPFNVSLDFGFARPSHVHQHLWLKRAKIYTDCQKHHRSTPSVAGFPACETLRTEKWISERIFSDGFEFLIGSDTIHVGILGDDADVLPRLGTYPAFFGGLLIVVEAAQEPISRESFNRYATTSPKAGLRGHPTSSSCAMSTRQTLYAHHRDPVAHGRGPQALHSSAGWHTTGVLAYWGPGKWQMGPHAPASCWHTIMATPRICLRWGILGTFSHRYEAINRLRRR